MTTTASSPIAGRTAGRTGGRGARERILAAATELFYANGINTTGIEQLAESAHVSKRTLYQHFASKDDLVVAYLERLDTDTLLPLTAALRQPGVPARDRLLGVFDADTAIRGCPYLNASAELSQLEHPARLAAKRRKQAFVDELIQVASEAGAHDPVRLGRQLGVLSDGARAQGAALQSRQPVDDARDVAELLVDTALR